MTIDRTKARIITIVITIFNVLAIGLGIIAYTKYKEVEWLKNELKNCQSNK